MSRPPAAWNVHGQRGYDLPANICGFDAHGPSAAIHPISNTFLNLGATWVLLVGSGGSRPVANVRFDLLP